MEKRKYQVTEQTAKILDALRVLDKGFELLTDAVDETYGDGSTEISKDFCTKYQSMKDEAEQLLLAVMMDNFSVIDRMEV